MNRKLTVTYEIPEELFVVLEQEAAAEGRRLEKVVAEHMARYQAPRRRMSAEEMERRAAAFERHIGAWRSGDENSSDNERIDADLAREYSS